MKHTRLAGFILFLTLLSGFLTGCDRSLTAPFTSLTWEHSYDDMTRLEGSDYKSYDSVYSGTTYSYPKKYLDIDGTIKYMYDAAGTLMCIAWVYSGDTDEDLKGMYDTIHDELVDVHGESGYNADSATNYGDVWYLDDGHIVLSVMTTDTQKALQYSYMNPKASEEET